MTGFFEGRILRDTLENEMCDRLTEALGPVEVGDRIAMSAPFQFVLEALECYISRVIREIHPEFGGALDGFEMVIARKVGPEEIELWGATYVISTKPDILTPLHLQFRIDRSRREVDWMECRLGVHEKGHLAGLSNGRLSSLMQRLEVEGATCDAVRWAYAVGFGER